MGPKIGSEIRKGLPMQPDMKRGLRVMFEDQVFKMPVEIAGNREVMTYQVSMFDNVVFRVSYEGYNRRQALTAGRKEFAEKFRRFLEPEVEF